MLETRVGLGGGNFAAVVIALQLCVILVQLGNPRRPYTAGECLYLQ